MNKLFNIKNAFLLMLSGVFILSSCEKPESVTTADLDMVVSAYDKTFNFKAKKTYAMPNKIVLVTDDDSPSNPEFVDQTSANIILGAIDRNLQAYGWQKVTDTTKADVILLPSVSKSTTFYYYYSWGYWGWYYPGYNPGWGWYYPGYYPPTMGSYTTGSVFMQMTDPKNVVSDKVPVVWTGIVNGLVDNTASMTSRINSTIDQAFKQSAYLKL